MKKLLQNVLIIGLLVGNSLVNARDNAADTSIVWEINSLSTIGGNPVTVSGNPQVVSTEIGDAVEFDGDGDRLLVHNNPIGDSQEYTVEIYFKPDNAYAIDNEPRFFHIQDTNDIAQKRVMMELRLTADGKWYLDGFMNTDAGNLTLVDDTKLHPTEDWMHAAITYTGNTFKTYVNGTLELTGTVNFTSAIVNTIGVTSLGSRMNRVHWYAGLIKTVKVSNYAKVPGEFMIDETTYRKPLIADIRLNAYPNPAQDYVHISFSSPAIENAEISVYNILGTAINTKTIKATEGDNTINLDTSDLPAGIYVISVKVKSEVYTRKLQIK